MDTRRRLIMAKRPVANIVDGVLVANVGDIAYKASNGKIKTIALDSWDASLGTAVGVVVIPSGFAPDNGLARIVALVEFSSEWQTTSEDASITNHNRVPITDNSGSLAGSYASSGYLPSDRWASSGVQSYVDNNAYYYSSDYDFCPSPYLNGNVNPEYYKAISGYRNALSDFAGLSNTQTLIQSSNNKAAILAASHVISGTELSMYLPSMGEMGYIMARFSLINQSIIKAGGTKIATSAYYWTSTEFSSTNVYTLFTNVGRVRNTSGKTGPYAVRPFAMLDF